jgi:PAS domain S-box-containing protein
MEYKKKTKDQLINELTKLYQRISELEKGENKRKLSEIELQTLEKRFKILAEESPNMIFINKKGRVAYANKRCEEIMGYSRDEYYSENFNFLDLIAPEYKDLVKENFKRHMSGKDSSPYDYKIITKDGREITAIITTKLTDYEGEKAILGIITDITERKKAEEQLRIVSNEWEATFNSINDLVSINDKDFNLVKVNKAFSDTLKKKSDELIGKKCYEVVHGTNEPWPDCPHRRTMKIKEPCTEEFFEPKLGIYLQVSTSPICNEKGELVGTVHIAKDINERKKAEEAVLNIAKGVSATYGDKFYNSISEHLAKTLEADCAYVAEIINKDPISARTLSLYVDGKIIDNIEVDLAGTPCETVREKTCSYSSGIQKLFPHADMMAKMNVEGYVGTPLFDSSLKWLGIMSVMYRKPIENVSTVESMLQIFAARAAAELERRKYDKKLKEAKEEIEEWNKELEIRVREKTKELLKSEAQLIQAEKLSSIGQLAAGVAHELNSPLTGLISMTRNYRDKAEKDSEEYRHFSLMYKACEYMANIVNDVNSFSSKSKGDHMECNLTEIIESSLSLVTNELKLKNIQLNKEYADEIPAVKGDKTELQQVVLNITTNSIDAMTDNGRLVIKTGISRHKNGVIMEFIDNGCGIGKKDINRVFEPFFTTKPHGKGTGLGLSVSYAIINNHGGKITVDSKLRKGTKFTIYLSAVKPNDT